MSEQVTPNTNTIDQPLAALQKLRSVLTPHAIDILDVKSIHNAEVVGGTDDDIELTIEVRVPVKKSSNA